MAVYSTPALEKGLDILELFAENPHPMTLTEVADELGRSKSELFRMISTLHARGYLHRDLDSDAFSLTDRLFRVGLRVPHVRSLLDCALPQMRILAEEIEQSVHLVVVRQGETVVIAASSGGSDMAFTLKLGFRRVAVNATSGQVVLAFQSDEVQRRIIEESKPLLKTTLNLEELNENLNKIKMQGYEMHESRDFVGISDICCPIFGSSGHAVASMIVSFVNRKEEKQNHNTVLRKLSKSCGAISQLLGAPSEIEREHS